MRRAERARKVEGGAGVAGVRERRIVGDRRGGADQIGWGRAYKRARKRGVAP